ncbi:hypothetical protein BJV77DRAFT_998119 [Russula vinacea]|nr:hypothetical protein BJV77DRAFT_998119 [Russula vinacea]
MGCLVLMKLLDSHIRTKTRNITGVDTAYRRVVASMGCEAKMTGCARNSSLCRYSRGSIRPSQFVSPCVSLELVSTESDTSLGFPNLDTCGRWGCGDNIEEMTQLDEPSCIFGDGRSVLQYSTFGTEA